MTILCIEVAGPLNDENSVLDAEMHIQESSEYWLEVDFDVLQISKPPWTIIRLSFCPTLPIFLLETLWNMIRIMQVDANELKRRP